MTGERAELADNAQHHRLRVDSLKPDLALAEISLNTVKPAEEIVIPERTPELAVGDGLKADVLLLFDDGRDFAIFDRLQRVGRDLAFLVFCPGLFQRRSAQQAADVVGPERRTATQRHATARAERAC